MGTRCGARAAAKALPVMLVAASLLAGCGSGSNDDGPRSAPPRTQAAKPATVTTPPAKPRFAAERASFRRHCAACHTLADADAHGTKAGGEANLDEIRPNVSSVRNFIVGGFGAMPSFRGRMSRREIDALARYVATVDGCGVRSPTACDAG